MEEFIIENEKAFFAPEANNKLIVDLDLDNCSLNSQLRRIHRAGLNTLPVQPTRHVIGARALILVLISTRTVRARRYGAPLTLALYKGNHKEKEDKKLTKTAPRRV